ncbi:MAG: hypothetical protein QHG99_05375, partial [Methanomicrobiales archaeon]|nr:hypothetical protein [Methanomicrobiales archaeon]
ASWEKGWNVGRFHLDPFRFPDGKLFTGVDTSRSRFPSSKGISRDHSIVKVSAACTMDQSLMEYSVTDACRGKYFLKTEKLHETWIIQITMMRWKFFMNMMNEMTPKKNCPIVSRIGNMKRYFEERSVPSSHLDIMEIRLFMNLRPLFRISDINCRTIDGRRSGQSGSSWPD